MTKTPIVINCFVGSMKRINFPISVQCSDNSEI